MSALIWVGECLRGLSEGLVAAQSSREMDP